MKQSLMLAHSAVARLWTLVLFICYTARRCDNNHIRHLINSSQGEYWRRTLCAQARYIKHILSIHTHIHPNTLAHKDNVHCLYHRNICMIYSSYLFIFQIMNFVAKPLHAYNYCLQLSAFPKHLAAAQIMFALNTAQCLAMAFWCCRKEEIFVSANEFESLSFVLLFFFFI